MIIIIGASGGIGNFIFNKYKDTANVIGTYFSNKTNQELQKLNIKNYNEVFDFADKFFDIDNIHIVNCFGLNYNIFLHKSNPDDWKNVIDTNLLGCYNIIRAFLPLMRKKQFGRIVNFSSVVAQVPTCGVSAYATSKAALWGLAKSIAAENASLNITINNINLGYANVGMGINDVSDKMKEMLLDRIPSESFCSSEDIFNTIEYIFNTQYLNGASIDINGAII